MWTVKQAANELGYSEPCIRAFCNQGRLEAYKTEGHSHYWIITSLNIKPAVRKSRYHKDVMLRYLDKLSPMSAIELEAIEIVKDLIHGKRHGYGATTSIILDYLEEHGESAPRDIALATKIKPHPIRVALSRLAINGKVQRVKQGLYRRISV